MTDYFVDWIIGAFDAPTTATATTYRLSHLDQPVSFVFSGTGFTYTDGVPTGGTIDTVSIVVNDGGGVLATLSGINISLADFGNLLDDIYSLRDIISWSSILATEGMPTVLTDTQIRLLNEDGTFTELLGTGLYVGVPAAFEGQVTSIRHIAANGTTVLTTINTNVSLNLAVAALFEEQASDLLFVLLNEGPNALMVMTNPITVGGDTYSIGLYDGPGDDVIEGNGDDWLSYEYATEGIFASLPNLFVGTGSDTDQVFGIANIDGSAFDDTMFGDDNENIFEGDDGDDTLNGGDGGDNLLGGAGVDIVNGDGGDDYLIAVEGQVGAGEEFNGGSGNDALVVRGTNVFGSTTISSIEQIVFNQDEDFATNTAIFSAAQIGSGALDSNIVVSGSATQDLLLFVSVAGGVNISGLTVVGWNIAAGDAIFLVSSASADAFVGAASVVEFASYGAAGASVHASLLNPGVNTGAAAGDTYANIAHLYGSNFNDTLDGDHNSNGLIGASGNDTLNGFNGNDFLTGGVGLDTMLGGAGDDTYDVENAGDVVVETANKGTDLVRSSVTWTLGNHLENLQLMSVGAINGTGNNVANTITGNDAANILTGLNGNDILDGGAGADTLVGGRNDDTYIVDNASDVISEFANKGADSVQTSVTYLLSNHIENLTLTGANAINGTGNGLANTITGNTGNNTLDGKAGADTMIGGLGDDTYVIESQGDVVTESAGQGTDSVRALFNYVLAANVENLTLAGTAANGSGNELNNTVRGNDLNNVLLGLDGADILIGGLGNDRLTGGNGADAFVFNTVANNTTNRDQITDFNVADDTIRMDNAVFASLGANGVLNAGFFVTGAAAADANDYIIYNSANGSLFYDADGNGAGAAVRFATVTAGLALTNADFLVV